jgi:uncharacterized protein
MGAAPHRSRRDAFLGRTPPNPRPGMALNLFGFLMPRGEAFVDLYCAQSRKISEAAEALRAIVNGNGSTAQHVATIRRLETEADAVAKRLIIAANRTFNAPIDRENLLGLAHDLDDVIDLIEDAAKAIERYAITDFPAEMRAMVDTVVQSILLIQEALPLLDSLTRDFRRVFELCERVGQIEGEADDYFDTGLNQLRAKLRNGEIDTPAYIDRKEIYEELEAVVDKCDDVANTIETITAKHV